MAKRKLCLGVFLGAILGGLVSLLDSDTRYYTKRKMNVAKSQSSYFMKNPSEGVRKLRKGFDTFNKKFSSSTESTLKMLEQAEETLDKFAKKSDAKLEGEANNPNTVSTTENINS
ncbi:YtxH domain-containing protein [Virgibacillus kekensis]|uniref:YtxH domain-containing protein n=1 Tax=Virgibacillus kekensis TaxID=202261 RepID=A0ABV9DG72_9BACI